MGAASIGETPVHDLDAKSPGADSLTVSPITLKLGTIADVTVDEGAITRNFGDASYLGVGAANRTTGRVF